MMSDGPLQLRSKEEAFNHLFNALPKEHNVRMELSRVPNVLKERE